MALYQDSNNLQQISDAAFNMSHNPGVPAPHAGIYKCEGCSDEIAIASGHILPPQNHYQHPSICRAIRWKLVVAAQQRQR